MEQLTLELPAMFGDHHVVEVRRLLFALPGVAEVYASSAFRAVEITFDPAQVDSETIKKTLDQAGYLGELPIPVESGIAVGAKSANGKKTYYRHTAVYENTRSVVGFSQQVSYSGRPLWPCPGMGPLTPKSQEEE